MKQNKPRILAVDDEPKIIEIVKSYLENSGYEVICAYNAKDCMSIVERFSPALLILDLMLPDIPGEDVCRAIRKKSDIPIIMLTAKVEEENILKGLDIGADDYMTKPFSPKQLVARVNALLRRTGSQGVKTFAGILSFNNDDLVIDNNARIVMKKSRPLSLTPNEFSIFSVLMNNPQRVFSREELVSLAYDCGNDSCDRTIDSHIKNIRKKIGDDPRSPRYIVTVHGIGYKFCGE